MKRIALPGLVFIICTLAILKTLAVMVPISFLYSAANALHIYGNGNILDFIFFLNVGLSVLISILFIFIIGKRGNENHF